MDITIREIEEKDYHAVAEILVNDLWENKFNSDNIVPFFSKVKNDESYKSFIALLNNNVVGFISAVTLFWTTSDSMLIQAFVVKSDYQNKGIGKKLLKHTENYAKAKGISSIILNSGVKRTDAHAFYQHNGYDKDSWCFDKRL